MNIGIVTTWFERGAAYVSKAYVDTLSDRNRVYVYARGGEEYATEDPAWDLEYVTWGKRVPGPLTRVDWVEFSEWLAESDVDIVIFSEL